MKSFYTAPEVCSLYFAENLVSEKFRMGKKKSSKKQMALAAAVEEAEQDVNEIKLNDDAIECSKDTNSRKTSKRKEAKKEERIIEAETDNKEELKFDYTGGENNEVKSEEPGN